MNKRNTLVGPQLQGRSADVLRPDWKRSLDLGAVEQAFRCFKTLDLKVRPIHHRLEGRVRAHVLP
jgi:hypothetical protein